MLCDWEGKLYLLCYSNGCTYDTVLDLLFVSHLSRISAIFTSPEFQDLDSITHWILGLQKRVEIVLLFEC